MLGWNQSSACQRFFAVFGGMTGASFVATPERRGDWAFFTACRGHRDQSVPATMGTFGKNPAERFCWPNHLLGFKIQIPVLLDFNTGICDFYPPPALLTPRGFVQVRRT